MDENVQELVFIWLQPIPSAVHTRDKSIPIEEIRAIINDVRIFDDVDECINYILSISDETVLFRQRKIVTLH